MPTLFSTFQGFWFNFCTHFTETLNTNAELTYNPKALKMYYPVIVSVVDLRGLISLAGASRKEDSQSVIKQKNYNG